MVGTGIIMIIVQGVIPLLITMGMYNVVMVLGLLIFTLVLQHKLQTITTDTYNVLMVLG
jgi:hypothetical protein